MAERHHLGNRIAPVRFLVFAAMLVAGFAALVVPLGWRHAAMAGFDIAAAAFLIGTWPLLHRARPQQMRLYAARNDANRSLLLAVTGAVSLVVLVAVFSELKEKSAWQPAAILLIIATLALAWLFSNMVYALHYAHLFYMRSDGAEGSDRQGLGFPGTDEPTYWDFVYFSFTLGMTFQTSDVSMTTTQVRRIATFHCLAAFVFNLGVLAFSINVLGGASS